MDAAKIFSIHKHTSLLTRFPEMRYVSQLSKSKANWIIYAPFLRAEYFEDIDFFTGYYNGIVDAWKVGPYDVALMAGELTCEHEKVLRGLEIDYARITEVPDLSQLGLIVLDMDSTAIQIECIDELANLAGVGEEVAAVTERAMQGELDFEQSLRLRVGKLKGADEGILEQVRVNLPLMPDLESVIATLHLFGWKTAIASGGFTYFSDYLQQTLNLDYARSNQLDISEGKLTGKVVGDVVTAQIKADILTELAQKYDIEMHNTVAVGDGANDLVMMAAAGLGVAYHAKPKVVAKAQASVRYTGLGGILCILSAGLVKQQKLTWQRKPGQASE